MNITDVLSDAYLNDPQNWKQAMPTQCTIYLTGLLNKQEVDRRINYMLWPAGEEHGMRLTIGSGQLLQYGPGRKYQRFWLKTPDMGLPCGDLNCIRQEDGSAFGIDIFKKNIKTYNSYNKSKTFEILPDSFRQSVYEAAEHFDYEDYADYYITPDYYAVLPWTKAIYTAPTNYNYYAFICPPSWQNIRVIGMMSDYLVARSASQEMFLNQNPNRPDVIVLPTPIDCALESVFNPEYFKAYAQYYDLETFAKMFDMRSFPSLASRVPKVNITMPAPLFTSDNCFNVAKEAVATPLSTTNDYAKVCLKNDSRGDAVRAIEWNWKYGGEQRTGYKMIKCDAVKDRINLPRNLISVTESQLHDTRFMTDLMNLKNEPLKLYCNLFCLTRKWTKANGDTAFYVKVDTKLDIVVLCAGYTTNIGVISPDYKTVFHDYPTPVSLEQAIQDAEKISGARQKEEDAFWAKAYGKREKSYDSTTHGKEIGEFYKSLYGM